ncbi:hypothetical protein AB0K43_23535 [Kitasatospora sp. NPDC049258]|uniref:hypothetical protein n=1 Tax=Kitasatospora sp. NPDC049258 TaxID=3155394 RepID=UPI00342A894C
MCPSTRLRLLRALLFSGVCTTLGALGHAMAGGGRAPWAAVLTGGVLAFGAALAAAGRERGPLAVTAGVLASQLGLHLWFAAWTPPTAPTDPARLLLDRLLCPAGAHLSVPAEQVPELLRAAGLDPDRLGPIAIGHHPSDWRTTAAHLLAALACAWWLRRGEAVFFRVLPGLRTAGRLRLPALLLAAAGRGPVPPRAGRTVERDPAPYRPPLLRHSLAGRAPPVLAPAA